MMRAVQSRSTEDPVWIWVRGLRAAMFASVAVALVACTVGPAVAHSEAVSESVDSEGSAATSLTVSAEEDPIDQTDAG